MPGISWPLASEPGHLCSWPAPLFSPGLAHFSDDHQELSRFRLSSGVCSQSSWGSISAQAHDKRSASYVLQGQNTVWDKLSWVTVRRRQRWPARQQINLHSIQSGVPSEQRASQRGATSAGRLGVLHAIAQHQCPAILLLSNWRRATQWVDYHPHPSLPPSCHNYTCDLHGGWAIHGLSCRPHPGGSYMVSLGQYRVHHFPGTEKWQRFNALPQWPGRELRWAGRKPYECSSHVQRSNIHSGWLASRTSASLDWTCWPSGDPGSSGCSFLGLCNEPTTFMDLMERVLVGVPQSHSVASSCIQLTSRAPWQIWGLPRHMKIPVGARPAVTLWTHRLTISSYNAIRLAMRS